MATTLLALITAAAGCGNGAPTETPLEACHQLRQTDCQRFSSCLGTGDAGFAVCLATQDKDNGTCDSQVASLPGNCTDSFRQTLDQCTARINAEVCGQVCPPPPDGGIFQFCFAFCDVYCPP